jgi:hypothetical protein
VTAVVLLVVKLASTCSIVEVTVPPAKAGKNVVIAVYDNNKPARNLAVLIEQIKNSKLTSLVPMASGTTDVNGEITVSGLALGAYVVYSTKGSEKVWLGALEVAPEITAELSHVKYDLYPMPPPPVPPPPILLRSMRGQLLDPSGAVIANTKFKIRQTKPASDGNELDSVTDASGEFSLTLLEGSYELSFRLPGFNPAIVPVTISRNDKGWAGLRLTLLLAECNPNPNPYHCSIAEATTTD